MSIFDRLSALITDSLLCTLPNFGDYPITACVPTNKGASLPFTNWNEEWCQCSKGRPITENYWIVKELKGWGWGGKREGCVVRLGLLVDFLWFHQKKDGWGDSPRQQPAGVCRRALQPKISEKRKWKNHAVPLQFILCIRVTPKQSFSSPAVRQLCVITWCSKNDIFIFF